MTINKIRNALFIEAFFFLILFFSFLGVSKSDFFLRRKNFLLDSTLLVSVFFVCARGRAWFVLLARGGALGHVLRAGRAWFVLFARGARLVYVVCARGALGLCCLRAGRAWRNIVLN